MNPIELFNGLGGMGKAGVVGAGVLLLVGILGRVVKKDKLLKMTLPWSGRIGRLLSIFLTGKLGMKAAHELEEGLISTVIAVIVENLKCFHDNLVSDNTEYAKMKKSAAGAVKAALIAVCCVGTLGCSKKTALVSPEPMDTIELQDPEPVTEASLDTIIEPIIEPSDIPLDNALVLFFAFDSDVLTETEAINLRVWYESVRPMTRIMLIGHACNEGPEEYNYGLGIRRAVRVENAFASMGFIDCDVRSVGENECNMDDQNLDRCRKVIITAP